MSRRAGSRYGRRGALRPAELIGLLSSVGHRTSSNGHLPEAALDDARSAAAQLDVILDTAGDEEQIAIAALSDAPGRGGLLQLLMHAVRNASGMRAMSKREAKKWELLFLVVTRLVKIYLDTRVASAPVPRPVESETVRLLIETDHLSVLSRQLAQIAEAASPPAPGQAAIANARLQEALDQRIAVAHTMHLVLSLVQLIHIRCYDHYVRMGFLDAVERSNVLEHLPRAVMMLLWRTASGPRSEETRVFMYNVVWALCMAFQSLLAVHQGHSDPRVGLWASKLLSGPYMQHFLLVHVVTQLHAADGGTTYGLPPGAELPVLHCHPNTVSRAELEHWGGAGTPPLEAGYLSYILELWMEYSFLESETRPPCSHAALRALCVRLIDAANAVLEDGRKQAAGQQRPQPPQPQPQSQQRRRREQQAARAGGGGAAAPPHARFHHPTCLRLASRALSCAITSAMKEGASVAPLWGCIVRTVHNAISEGLENPEGLGKISLRELLRGRLPQVLLGEDPLPLEAPPDFAAPLAAGYVPCLERLQRHMCAGNRPVDTMEAAKMLADHYSDFSKLAGMFAYGELRPVAALIATGAKLLSQATAGVELARAAGQAVPLEQFQRTLTEFGNGDNVVYGLYLSLVDVIGSEGFRRFSSWWQQADAGGPGGGASAPLAAGSQAGGGGSGGNQGGSGAAEGAAAAAGNGRSGEGTGASGSAAAAAAVDPAEPTTRLLTLATHTLMRWLPALASAAVTMHGIYMDSCDASPPPPGAVKEGWRLLVTTLTQGVFVWAPYIAHAYVLSLTHDAHNNTQPTSPEAASWRRLLLQDADFFRLLRLYMQFLRVEWVRNNNKKSPQLATLVAAVLTPLAVAFPDEVQAVMSAPAATRGPLAGTSNIEMLKLVLGPHTDVLHLMRIAVKVCEGWRPTLAGSQEVCSNECGVGRFLPPPCAVSACLRLPACSNPLCRCLAGDSEAALPLQACAGRCGGAVAYCSRECQAAHWKAAHKQQCGKKTAVEGAPVAV